MEADLPSLTQRVDESFAEFAKMPAGTEEDHSFCDNGRGTRFCDGCKGPELAHRRGIDRAEGAGLSFNEHDLVADNRR